MKQLITQTIPILALFLCACASNQKRDYRFIEIPEAINKDPQKTLSVDEVKHDISQAIYALDTAYSGKKFLPGGQYQGLVKDLGEITGPSSVANLCEKIDGYMDAVSDNHLGAKFNTRFCFSNSKSHKDGVGKNFYSEKNDIQWKVQTSRQKKKTALLISITGFPKSTSPVWNGFIDAVKAQMSKVDFIVLDMRGNGGGDDTKGFELSTLLAGKKLKTPYGQQWNNPNPEAYQMFVNTFEYWARLRRDEGKEVPAYILDLKKEFIAKRDLALKGTLPDPAGDDGGGKDFDLNKSVRKPIYILIDADCASSCESTTDFLEFNTLAKTVGENTAGYVHFGNNGNVFLKNSGINLQMAMSYNTYLDGRFIEKTGIPPKIRVPA